MSRPSTDQLQRALVISEQIQKLEAELANILGNTAATPTTKRAYTKRETTDVAAPAKKKPVFSPEALARISAAQKKRWALKKKAVSTSPSPVAPPAKKKQKKTKMSAQGLANIIAAQKKR